MKTNDRVLINSTDGYNGKFGIVKKLLDKTTYNVGVEIIGVSSIVWFNETDLIKC